MKEMNFKIENTLRICLCIMICGSSARKLLEFIGDYTK